MTFAERALYHQIHPAKLFADISTAVIGIDFFWRHELAPGLIIALFPPPGITSPPASTAARRVHGLHEKGGGEIWRA